MAEHSEIREKVAKQLHRQPADLEDAATLTDLVVDSFLLVDMVISLQDDLGVILVQDDLKDVKTVASGIDFQLRSDTGQFGQVSREAMEIGHILRLSRGILTSRGKVPVTRSACFVRPACCLIGRRSKEIVAHLDDRVRGHDIYFDQLLIDGHSGVWG